MNNGSLVWEHFPAAKLEEDRELQSEWNRLNASGSNLPFLDVAVMRNALVTFGDGCERLFVGRLDQRALAMLIARPVGSFRWQTFQPSQLPLGAMVVAKETCPDVLLDGLVMSGPDLKLVFSLTQLDPVLVARTPDTARTFSADYIETAWIDIAGDFDAYWNARGKNLRHNLRKQKKKLDAEGIVVTTREITAAEDMSSAIARYGAMEVSGWKALSGTAVHPENPQGRFYERLLEDAAGKGEAVVYEYLLNDQAVASNLCLVRGKTMTILKTAYDERAHAYSPAFLLMQEMLQLLHAEGKVRTIEFYGRVMEWHTRWTEEKRTLYHITCYRWPILKVIAAAMRRKKLAAAQLPAHLA